MGKVCKYCGNTLNDGDKFCQKCGGVVEEASTNQTTAEVVNNISDTQNNNQSQSEYSGKTNGTAIASLVCSLVGIIIAAIPLGIVSICLSAAAMKHISAFPGEKGKGMAIAGLVIGIIDIVFGVIGVIINSSVLLQ